MKKYRIIDAHSHIFPHKIAEKATINIGHFYDIPMTHIGSSEHLLTSGVRIEVEKFLVCSTATRPAQVESINTFIHEECKLHDKFYGFATMHPDYEHIEAELDRVVEMGLHGIKLHPDFQLFDIDDKNADRMYKAASDRNLPILFHTGDNRYNYSAPHRLRAIADRFPDLLCIGAHFGGYRLWDESMDTLLDCKNVLFDTSSSLMFLEPAHAVDMIHHFGVERFMWGSDFPMWDHKDELERFMALPLTEDERERIFHGTFEEYFHCNIH